MGELKKKLLGASLAVFAGLCYGFNLAPVTYLQQKVSQIIERKQRLISLLLDQYPCAGPFNFAFSHFSGIFFTSTVILLVYAIVKRNRPFIERRSVIVGLIAGCLWALAQFRVVFFFVPSCFCLKCFFNRCAWFASNESLGQPGIGEKKIDDSLFFHCGFDRFSMKVAFPIIATGPVAGGELVGSALFQGN
jgi:hypothetical protein